MKEIPIDYKEVKRRYKKVNDLDWQIAKIERQDPNWRKTPAGQDLLEQYSKALDKKWECHKYYTEQECIAYALAPDLGYGGSF